MTRRRGEKCETSETGKATGRARRGKTAENRGQKADDRRQEKRESLVGAAFQPRNYWFSDFNGFYSFYVFYDLPFTVHRLPFTI